MVVWRSPSTLSIEHSTFIIAVGRSAVLADSPFSRFADSTGCPSAPSARRHLTFSHRHRSFFASQPTASSTTSIE
jgi:hypothetical protein